MLNSWPSRLWPIRVARWHFSEVQEIYYLSYRTTQALKLSESVLNDEALFGQITSDRHLGRAMDIFGVEDNDEDEDNGVGTVTFANADSNDDDDEDDDENVLSFGHGSKIGRR